MADHKMLKKTKIMSQFQTQKIKWQWIFKNNYL